MQEKTRRAAGALGKAVLYGGAAALGLAILTFLFAFLTGGFDARLGLDWARRVLYVIGGVCVVVSGAGLFFAGDAPRDQRIGFKKDETLSAFERAPGISWPWALLAGSVAFFLLGVILDPNSDSELGSTATPHGVRQKVVNSSTCPFAERPPTYPLTREPKTFRAAATRGRRLLD